MVYVWLHVLPFSSREAEESVDIAPVGGQCRCFGCLSSCIRLVVVFAFLKVIVPLCKDYHRQTYVCAKSPQQFLQQSCLGFQSAFD